jgi:dipeptidyl aminopeptidase/acylaminoacyl peptidase
MLRKRSRAPCPRTAARGSLRLFGLAAVHATALATPLAFNAVGTIHEFSGVALSSDGTQVAAVESAGGSNAPRGVVVRNAGDGAVMAVFDPCKTCSYADPAWSPDGQSLAFVGRDPQEGRSWMWVARGTALQRPVTFDGLLAKPRYSPDGRTLAVLATEHPSKEAGPYGAQPSQVGDLDARPTDERRIAVVDPSHRALRLVSPGDRYVYEYDWAPDGKGFAATDAVGDPDGEWYVARLEFVDLATGGARTLAAPKLQVNYPLPAADGKSVLFIGGLMSDAGEVGGDIWAVPIAGGEPRNLTPGFNGSFNSLQRRGDTLYATAVVLDHFALYGLKADGTLKLLWTDPGTVRAGDARISLSSDGNHLATVQQSFTIAPRIVAGALDSTRPITHENDGFAGNADVRSVNFTNEGLTIQGWLLAPKGLQPGKRYPMAVYVHGGPAHFQEARFHFDDEWRELIDRGYFIFVPNIRGSFGQGEAFTRANVMDLGGGDLRDILAGVDAVEKIAPIDEQRLAIFGHSYGGFMVAWAVTQTNRFKAAVASTTLANWISDYGQEGIPKWMAPYFHGISPYDQPEIFDRISPVRFIKRVKTPTFIYGGASDLEAPASQSLELWSALKEAGVPTSLVLYPGEGHKFSSAGNDRDASQRTVAWFEKYVGGGAR